MALQLRNQFGVLDVSVIDPAEVALMSDAQQTALSVVVTAVESREAAAERVNRAVIAVRDATAEQLAAHAAHVEASQPFPFKVPPEIEQMTDPRQRASAMAEARERHNQRVREHRQAEARAASIAAYNATH